MEHYRKTYAAKFAKWPGQMWKGDKKSGKNESSFVWQPWTNSPKSFGFMIIMPVTYDLHVLPSHSLISLSLFVFDMKHNLWINLWFPSGIGLIQYKSLMLDIYAEPNSINIPILSKMTFNLVTVVHSKNLYIYIKMEVCSKFH